MTNIDFTHLHVHTQFSLLDGLCKNEDLAAAAKAHGMDALAITDHGAMYGAVHFYNAMRKAEIKPIIGLEAYYTAGSRFDRSRDFKTNHLLLFAKNLEGYRNLMQITTLAHLEGFYYKPRLDWELLEKYRGGLITTSGCPQGEIPQAIQKGDMAKAEELLKKYLDLFKDDYYIELQRHTGLEKMLDPLNKELVALSRKYGVPIIATNDVHYVNQEDARAQDALLSIQTRTTLDDKNRFTMIDSPTYYLKSKSEMADLFADLPDAISNTRQIVDKCNLEIPTGKMIYPLYPVPNKLTPEEHLKKMVRDKISTRYPSKSPEILERVEYELEVICDKGYASYFLIVQDFINWAKGCGIRIGPGRGSAAGSIVSYILRITSIDPLIHGLQFERFLNPQRPSPPDIDVDIADISRDRVIQYVSEKYGLDRVAQVITFGTMEARAAIRDIGRVLGLPYSEPDRVAKLIPLGNSISTALAGVSELQEMYKDPKYKELLDLARKVEGVARHASTHAAAVIIADAPIVKYAPIQRDSKGGNITTQYDMYALDLNVKDDAIGLMKMDFLGLRNLSILQSAINLVEKEKGIKVDLSGLPLDDKKVFEMISRGETTGVFQMESGGMRRLAKQLRPDVFSDIVALIALYRPGPMALIPDFIKGKLEPDTVKYLHPDLKAILGETYGIIVYQEQVLRIANVMAGYSLGEADILRRAMGKKSVATMNKEHKKFLAQAVKKAYSRDIAEKVWSFIEKFAGYGFNKAHATSYAMIAYQTAYMKAHYPVEYMTALMSAESGKEDKLFMSLEECRDMEIRVLPPDINKSASDFSVEEVAGSLNNKGIRFGLQAIKNVGSAAIDNILSERSGAGDFKSFTDFVARVDNQKVTKKVFESLIKVGSFDIFGKRSVLLDEIDAIRNRIGKANSGPTNQTGLFDSLIDKMDLVEDKFDSNKPEYSNRELMEMERSLLGIYLREHPSVAKLKKIRTEWMSKIIDLDEKKGQKTTIAGLVKTIRVVFTKSSNKEMAFITLGDESDTVDVVIFPKVYETAKSLIIENSVLVIKGKVEEREETISILADSVETVSDDPEEDEDDKNQVIVPRGTSKATLLELNKLLQSNRGTDELTLIFKNGAGERKLLLPFGVRYTPELTNKILSLLRTQTIED